jgi:Tol biopolymer transport system component
MSDLTDLPTSRIGRYEVLGLLGRGGMGVVYEAIDSSLGRRVALKVLPPTVADDAHRLARFVQEARAASALNHPNVVTIYEIGHDRAGESEVHFIAMELVDGGDLRGLLTGTRLAVPRAVELVAQVSDAVACAHAAGIIHRDLKPENIVMSKTGVPKVLDFGLAKLHAVEDDHDGDTAVRSTDSGVILGTAGYMSPEQALGRPADHRSDIFSLGCILYEAVTGRRAFAAGSKIETLNAIIHSDPPPLRELVRSAPSELQRIVSKAIAKDPEERYQSAKDLVVDLRALLRAQIPEGNRRRGLVLALAGAAALLIAGAIGWALFSSTGRPPAAPTPAAAKLNVRRLTARGTVTHATISPDGRFVAFALLDRGIRLRQLATGQEIEIVAPSSRPIWGITFTPDGNSIVFATRSEENPLGACYRVATIGGRPERLFDGIDSTPAVSPDGRQIAWARAEYPKPRQSALLVANMDGSGVRTLAVRDAPERFAPLLFAGPSWAPDGASIATAVERTAEPVTAKLIVIDAKTGAETVLLDRGWPLITDVEWLADGSGIVTCASDDGMDLTHLQLWHIAYPSGEPRAITAEVASYRGVSIAAQQDIIVSIVVEASAQVWSVPLAGEGIAEKISAGRYDGWRGLTLTSDGRLVFSSIEEEQQTLMISNRDGSARSRLTRDAFSNEYPAAFPGGIAYVSTTSQGNEICVTSAEGEGRRVVVPDVDRSPIAVSADGRWVLYQRNRRLWKSPLAGGESTLLLDQVSSAPAWSPNGDRIAVLLGDSSTFAAEVAVLTAEGRRVWSAPFTGAHAGSFIRWLRDGSGIIVNGGPRGTRDDRNLWLYPLGGEPRPMTQFTDQRAYFWDLSPDGRTAYLSRANLTRDAVMVTGFR